MPTWCPSFATGLLYNNKITFQLLLIDSNYAHIIISQGLSCLGRYRGLLYVFLNQVISAHLEAGYMITHLAFRLHFRRFWSFIGLLFLHLSMAALPWSRRIVTRVIRDFNISFILRSWLNGGFLLSFYRDFTNIWFTPDIK